jgi:hypothetical protein
MSLGNVVHFQLHPDHNVCIFYHNRQFLYRPISIGNLCAETRNFVTAWQYLKFLISKRYFSTPTFRRLDSLLGESGQTSRLIRLRHFPHARTKLVSSKICIGLINVDFFHIVMQISGGILRDTTFTTVNLPIGTVSWKGSVIFQFILTSHLLIFEDKNLKFPWFNFAIFFMIS